jgi:hypothetical protein
MVLIFEVSMKMMSMATASLKSSKADGFATLWAWASRNVRKCCTSSSVPQQLSLYLLLQE